jgi:dTDP-4-amino-4,6-dideoxygalactose transaminase
MGEPVLDPVALAVDGGRPVRSEPFAAWPSFEPADAAAVGDVLLSGRVNYWTGEEGRLFEKEFAAHCGSRYGIALANGTVALELALLALGVGPGDEVIVTSRSFIASAAAPVLVGARAVFADVDRDSQNITAETIAPLITERTRAVIVVHLSGWPCEMDPILELASGRGVKVIEDCAQAHGARYRGRPVGGLGDVGVFSFCQDKIMTTGGEGGLLVTDDEDVWRRAWAYKDHGKSHRAVYETEHAPGFKWLHESLGTNWRMTELQAVLGRRQLQLLPDWHRRRSENAAVLNEGLRGLRGLRVPEVPAHCEHAWYKYYAFLDLDALGEGWTRDKVKHAINVEGVPCFMGSCPEIYRELAFASTDMALASRLPAAMELGRTSMQFLVHPTLGRAEMEDTVAAVRKVLAVAVR